MIRITVRTIWQGKVGIPGKYVERALRNREGLVIGYKDDYMVIPPSEVRNRIVSESGESFNDLYSPGTYRLLYFKWVPTSKQKRLPLNKDKVYV